MSGTDCASRPRSDGQHPTLLLLLLDGVAYERIRGLYDAGHFRRFRPPAKLISVFPTLTDPAYDLLFGTGPTPGYEAGYFDRAANRSSWALATYLRGGNEAWVRYCDYRLSFVKDAIMYLLPHWVYHRELRRARRVLDRGLRAGRRQVVIYILSTDGLGHMLPAPEIDRELLLLERWTTHALDDYQHRLRIVMLSDHGLSRVPAGCPHVSRFDLSGVLRSAGLRLVRQLRHPGDVALPLFGLLDVARLHCYDEATRAQAVAALRCCPEVELLAVNEDTRVVVIAGQEYAEVRCLDGDQDGPQYSYTPKVGDPLHLAEACAGLRAAGRAGPAGFAPRRAWLEATADLPFPAAPQRLWEGLRSISREQPDIVVSLKERWYVGSGLLSRFVRMQGTHGGLHRRASETFAMATGLDLESPLDLRDLANRLREELGWQPGGNR